MKACVFCQPQPYLLENERAAAFYDQQPVSPGHLLIIPKHHFRTLFDVPVTDTAALWALVAQAKQVLDARWHPAGYNVGVNVGPVAGQTVMHCHVHLIPRYPGDVVNPRGGVRNLMVSQTTDF